MKKLLLFFVCVLVSIGTWAGSSTGEQSGSDIIITINDDPGLENFTAKDDWNTYGTEFIDRVGWNNNTIFIKGTPLNSAGINVIGNALGTWHSVTLDITDCSIEGDLTAIPSQFNKILFAPGTTLPAESILKTGTGLKYAYSADDKSIDGVEINLYVGSVTSLSDITELDQSTLNANTIVNLTGDINGTIKAALIAAGVSKDNIKTPVVVDKTTCPVTGGSVKEDVKKYASENNIAITEDGIPTTRIRRILVTGGTLTQEEIDYIATLNVEILNMQDAQYADGVKWKFPSSVEQLVMPEGTIGHAEFGDLTRYENLIYAVDGAFKRLYLPNHGEAGFFTTDMLAGVPNQIVLIVEGIAISGKINPTDFDNVQNTFKNAEMFNLHSATLVDGSLADFGSKITTKRPNYADFVAPEGTTADELKTLSNCGNIGCSYSVLTDGTFNIYIKNGDRHDLKIAKYESAKTTKAVFVSNATESSLGWADGKVNDHVIEALNETKYIVSVDFSQLPIVNDKDEVLKGLTNSNIKYVRLPNNCPITESTYNGTTIEIVSRLIPENRSDARLENGSESLSVAEIFSNKVGGLASAAEYKNTDVNSADVMRLKGNINEADLAGLDTENRYMDFTELTNPPADFSNLSQGKAEYIALPNGVVIPEGIAASKGVGSFKTENGELTFNSKEEGSVLNVLWMMNDLITTDNKITSLVMSGPLNAFDVSNKIDAGLEMSKKTGHLVTKVDADDENISGGAFNLVAGKYEITSADFSNAVFYENTEAAGEEKSDMVFSQFGTMNDLANLKLPTSEKQTLIPDECLMGTAASFVNLKELCIPYNYTIIGKLAFHNTNISHITTTDPDGNSIVEHGANTITLSANLKEIRSVGNEAEPTFFGTGMDKVTDVYVLAVNAPRCGAHAFTGSLTTGNNGFAGNGAHPIQRANYVNGGQIIAILHYPHESTKNGEDAKYTDVTREYTLSDETGATDSWGNTLMWPKHDEFWRSYRQAVHGHIWNSWIVDNGTGGVISEYDEANVVENAPTYDQTYQGWHEFVLADNYNTIDWDPQAYFAESGFVEKDWYTLCVPYDIKKSDLLEALGVKKGNQVQTRDSEGMTEATEDMYPDVRTLTHVSRSVESGKVTLHLSKNLVNSGENGQPVEVVIPNNGQGYTYNTLTDTDPVIIKGGYPYLIRPYIPDNPSIKSIGKYVMAVADECKYDEGSYKYADKYLLPCVDYQIHAMNADKSTENNPVYVYEDAEGKVPCYYHFIGTYSKDIIPQYSYYLGEHKTTAKHQFFRADVENLPWNQYSAIIVKKDADETINYTVSDAADETNITLNIKVEDDLVVLAGETDDPTQVGKSMSLVFDESGETTAIQGVTTVDNNVIVGIGKVYNVNGQYMGVSTSNLPKGIYIRDGKKFVVK